MTIQPFFPIIEHIFHFFLPYIFQHISHSTVFVFFQPLIYQKVQLLQYILAMTSGISVIYSFLDKSFCRHFFVIKIMELPSTFLNNQKYVRHFLPFLFWFCIFLILISLYFNLCFADFIFSAF